MNRATINRLRKLEAGFAERSDVVEIEAKPAETDEQAIRRVFGKRVPADIKARVISAPLSSDEWQAMVAEWQARTPGEPTQGTEEQLNRSGLPLGPAPMRIIRYGEVYR